MLLRRTPLLTDGRASDKALAALLKHLLELGMYSALELASIQHCDLRCWHPWSLHPHSVVAELTGCVTRPENAAAPHYIVDRWESIQQGISRIADVSVVAGDTFGIRVSEYSTL